MYHPSRGGVRGGSDQFTWDSVKVDKHRENYLGHSLMAPIGRWQKGKDLSWYSKERKSGDNSKVQEKLKQIAAIKKAEEDAMLVALGFKSAEKEVKHIAKEEMTEVLRRNVVEQDNGNSERVHGVGIGSGRASMVMNGSKQNEGVIFESSSKSCKNSTAVNYKNKSAFGKSSKSKACRKLKREKKEKHKKKPHKKQLSGSEDNYSNMKRHKKKKKHHQH